MIELLADENILGLDALPRDQVRVTRCAGRDITARHLRDKDALWVRSVTAVDASLLDGSSLRFVGTATAGLEHIDRDYLQRRNIPFSSAPGANANAVVEYVLAALLELERPWQTLDGGGELGVVGYGAVGRRLTAVAESLGWRVNVYDPYLDSAAAGRPLQSLRSVLSCHVISLHCSYSRHGAWPSHHLLDRENLAQLNASQTLINAARGAVVDNAALLERLKEADSPQVVLDVWEEEPAFNSSLFQCPALRLGTAHIAGYSWQAKANGTTMLWDEMCRLGFVRGDLALAASPDEGGCQAASTAIDARTLVGLSYRIGEDDSRLRAVADLTDEERSRAFDRLRREHPIRFELATLPIDENIRLDATASRLRVALRAALRSPTGGA